MSSGNLKEEIKLTIENVKHKKVEGTLYLMSERIAWMPKQKDIIQVSHHYGDIKTQKISTEGKARVQLQVVLHDESSSVFHFISPDGPTQQLKDRDKVKDFLAISIQKFKQQMTQELEEKKRILIENPKIYQLYNVLVVGQLVSAEDFWKNYVDFNEFKQETKNQLTGVSQGFMANICPKSDGTNGLVYNISFDDIESIFKTYPNVKQKYSENVPHIMSEKDFWTKFFQSYYFRRDQTSTSKDLFSDCSEKEDQELKSKAQKNLVGPVAIIDSQKDFSNEDGFGLTDFALNKQQNLSHQNLIKRYNYYSMRVLNSMEETSSKDSRLNKIENGAAKKIRLDEEIKDLRDENEISLRGAQLHLTHIDRYFYGPKTTEQKVSNIDTLLKNQNTKALCDNTMKSLEEWNLNVKNITNPVLATSILVELTPGSKLMQSEAVQNLKQEIPKITQDEIKALYISSCEMLRHFWACFPPKNIELENKLKLMKETLENFYQQKIILFRDKLAKENFAWNLTSHLENMFNIAFVKYSNWQSKQKS